MSFVEIRTWCQERVSISARHIVTIAETTHPSNGEPGSSITLSALANNQSAIWYIVPESYDSLMKRVAEALK